MTLRNDLMMSLLGLGATLLAAETPRVAVLDLGFGATTNEFGCMSDPAVFERALAPCARVTRLSGAELCSTSAFSRAAFDMLVVPTGAAFPLDAVQPLRSFLSKGGHLLACGGYAFDVPVVATKEGRWMRAGAQLGEIPPGTRPLALPAPKTWFAANEETGVATRIAAARGPGGEEAVSVSTPRLGMWNTAIAAFAPGACTVISLRAKGAANTPAAWFELNERDGARWRAKLELTTDWKDFNLTPAQFTYWAHGSPAGRGARGDHVDFSKVVRVSLGFAADCATPGAAYGVTLCGLKAGDDPLVDLRLRTLPRINTRTGRIRDAIHPDAEQLQVFDCCETLLRVATTATDPLLRGVVPDYAPAGALQGLSARAQLGVNGHGFGPNRCAWRPLLTCRDAAGALRGYAGALVYNFAGTYRGSNWAIFGVTDRDLFPADDARAAAFLRGVVAALVEGASLGETGPEYSCARVGETAKLRTTVMNAGRAPRDFSVRFRLADEAGRVVFAATNAVRVAAGAREVVEAAWPVPADAPDDMDFTAELCDGDAAAHVRDREEAALVVWSPAVIARGPKLAREGTRFALDGETRFWAGAQTFWGQHGCVTARSPRRFRDDFRQMRSFGLRWTRAFLPCRNEAERRDSDAVVQLAQKFGLVIYHTPNLGNTDSRKELDRERAILTEICTRYRDVPGFAIDLCNEPSFTFNERIDTYEKATAAQRAWAKELTEVAHATRPGTLVSVGWSQGWAGGKATKDVQVASLDLDFTDRHYYGLYTLFMNNVKDVDLRVLGKPLLVGECGSKNHPTFQKEDPWGHKDDDAKYDTRFRYLYSHAFGCGAAGLLSWHWHDPIEGQFPCGLVMPSGVPRPTAYVVGKLARAFGRLPLAENPPDVVVLMDEAARMTPERGKAVAAAWDMDAALRWWGANWSALTSSRAADIPKGVKLVLKPEDFAGMDEAARRAAVGERLQASGAFFTRRAEDPETLETFRVPGRGGVVGWVFWNEGEKPITVARGGQTLVVGPKRVGYLQLAADGSVQAKEEL